jgi:CRISPR-associated endonuclease/helicase Cas3
MVVLHTASSYAEFFHELTGNPAYPYQERLGTEPWPALLDVPTGLGKTAAIVVAWLWKRLQGDRDTPRRLVYCLPMRVLVEQTVRNAREWVKSSTEAFATLGRPAPRVETLVGGTVETAWVLHPDEPAILVGTQDMLLSRALMRGYGMNPFQWPIHFGLLHNDALWVFDEVQLMGPGIPTSAQLEGLRDRLGTARPARSLWASATLDPAWLDTYDHRAETTTPRRLALEDADRRQQSVRERLNAHKAVRRASAVFDASRAKRRAAPYHQALASEIAGLHRARMTTLAVLNQVERAQGVYGRLLRATVPLETELLVLHSRFRPPDRRRLEARLRGDPPAGGRIIVSTQVVEAGVDLTSAALITELCPWPSFVQRCGRCNRDGKQADALVVWVDLDLDVAEAARPYEPEPLQRCRERLAGLADAAPAALPPTREPIPAFHVLRERDLRDLFNTDPDLSGFHVDVGPYIRGTDESTLQVFWRSLDGQPGEDIVEPADDELCPAAIGAVADAIESRPAWQWDHLAGGWRPLAGRRDLRPGMTLLLDAAHGGYSSELGFHPALKEPVEPLAPIEERKPDRYGGDRLTAGAAWVPLQDHLDHVVDAVGALAEALEADEQEIRPLATAARWHDLGKAHEVFQSDLIRSLPEADPRRQELWAKSGRSFGPASPAEEPSPRRRYFRHELASALAWLAHRGTEPDVDLIAYLIAAHHGKVRLGLRALSEEPPAEDGRLFARGVWEGDRLPPVELGGAETAGETVLSLDLMRLGEGPQGPSWAARTQQLLERLGPFRLAWLEALLRIADWRASAAEREEAKE